MEHFVLQFKHKLVSIACASNPIAPMLLQNYDGAAVRARAKHAAQFISECSAKKAATMLTVYSVSAPQTSFASSMRMRPTPQLNGPYCSRSFSICRLHGGES